MTKVYFRADASLEIGFGHFFRSFALAEMLSGHFECTFFLHDAVKSVQKQCESAFPLVRLKDRFDDFLSFLHGNEIVVLDNYFYTDEYRKKIKDRGCTLVCINDFSNDLRFADVTINHGLRKMGPQWALLRKPFRESVPLCERPNLTICFGGSDSLGLVDKLNAILGDCRWNIVPLHGTGRSAEEMAEIFRSSEICILSASSVCYEALSCGCRLVVGSYVDNQIEFQEDLVHYGYAASLGDLREHIPSREELLDAIENAPANKWPDSSGIAPGYVQLFQSLLCRRDWHIDGFDFVNYTHLSLERKLEALRCRNDESVRKWMRNTDVIQEESHLSYIEGLKTRNDAFYWAVYRDGVFCGGVSLVDMKDSTADEGIFLNPALSGRGLGTEISRASFKLYFDIIGLDSIYSLVNENNFAALKMDERLGFTLSQPQNGFVRIEKSRP